MTPNEDPTELLTIEEVAGRLKVERRPCATGSDAASSTPTRSARNGACAETTSSDTSKPDASGPSPPPPAGSGIPTARRSDAATRARATAPNPRTSRPCWYVRESSRLTRERSQVRNPPRPLERPMFEVTLPGVPTVPEGQTRLGVVRGDGPRGAARARSARIRQPAVQRQHTKRCGPVGSDAASRPGEQLRAAASGTLASLSSAVAYKARAPAASARRRASPSKRVLPIPASPSTGRHRRFPPTAASTTSPSTASSDSRSMSTSTKPLSSRARVPAMPPDHVQGPVQGALPVADHVATDEACSIPERSPDDCPPRRTQPHAGGPRSGLRRPPSRLDRRSTRLLRGLPPARARDRTCAVADDVGRRRRARRRRTRAGAGRGPGDGRLSRESQPTVRLTQVAAVF